ncbi:site-specific DNA-methyltransferase [Corynebacterium sp. CCUG 71335]|uniref:site-specific DNA-methyltransferase n=1 Tax=Corynebacterium sp. CCUG 71335 TaxID=2823892 RepID=UPI002108E6B2|nr:DNA methyltransferase [Corynebacterium sp. CCUG 71335]MCQ4620720.1 site-specific DNA-methyltransferase [Corynebacterium sp. CCUG 71335]
MSRLSDLIAQAKKENPRLGAALEQEFHARTNRTFGLVFERHLPEEVELPGRPVHRGDTVHVLPPRGLDETPDTRTWIVTDIRRTDTGRVAQLVEAHPQADEQPEMKDAVDVADLVVTAEQDDVIYPGLVQTGEVIGSDDENAPFHSVINAENYHALKMLTYTHYHSIDCIYIDPPYNTGAKDWKYNNDYVDGDDGYRHSKWLSFMERRLLVAKQLLNPDNSVLIVTIDEKEYLRLGMLLEQTFPEARIQMVSSVISSQGSVRGGDFARCGEMIFFVMLGISGPTKSDDDMLNEGLSETKSQLWFQYIRTGKGQIRSARPALFFPIFADPATGKIHSIGDPLPLDQERESVSVPDGLIAVWPERPDGTEGYWRTSVTNARSRANKGLLRLGQSNRTSSGLSVMTVNSGTEKRIESGEVVVTGYAENGAAILDEVVGSNLRNPKSIWNKVSHNAGWHGTKLNLRLLPGREFPYPKSLYAVEDALRFFVKDKPDATVLDFFSGSGTTAHAVMRLNKQDGGRRRSISVTNNEVSADEQVALRAQGYRPGDPEWEQWGICDYVTKPRVEAAITGRTPAGEPIKGSYKFTDEFPMADGFDANARFFTLTYEAPTRVRHNRAFPEIAPMLWMRAGQSGRIIDQIPERGWDLTNSYGVIENVAASADFVAAVQQSESVKVVYIVTNDDLVFESMARELADTGTELVRLYSTYLNNFAFQQTRENR